MSPCEFDLEQAFVEWYRQETCQTLDKALWKFVPGGHK